MQNIFQRKIKNNVNNINNKNNNNKSISYINRSKSTSIPNSNISTVRNEEMKRKNLQKLIMKTSSIKIENNNNNNNNNNYNNNNNNNNNNNDNIYILENNIKGKKINNNNNYLIKKTQLIKIIKI